MVMRLHSRLDYRIKSIYHRLLGKRGRQYVNRFLALPEMLPFALAAIGGVQSINHKRILSLRDKHKNQRCFIIGSGPSVMEMDLSYLKGEVTFGFNAFYLIKEVIGFLPTYYLVEDPLPAEDNASIINGLSGTTKIFPSDLRYCLTTDPNTIYIYLNRTYADYPNPNFPKFSKNILRCVYWGGTVAYMAIQVAFYMGIREIYLIGIDLDYKVPALAGSDIITSEQADVSHFHPDYFGPGKRWHDPKVERMQYSFGAAGNFLHDNGGVIYNATAGGNLKSLQRVSYNNLFGQSKIVA